MLKKRILVAALAISSVTATTAIAGQWNWLSDYPAKHFTAEDWDLLQTAAFDLYDKNTGKSSVSWSNPESGNSGVVTVISSETKDGMECRKSRISNRTAKNLEGSGVYLFCKNGSGEWKIVEDK